MKIISVFCLIFSIAAVQQLQVPPFDLVQLTSSELAQSCKDNSRKSDAVLFVRKIRYISVLKNFIDILKSDIVNLSQQIGDVINDSNLKRAHIASLQTTIIDTQNLIDEVKQNIGITFNSLQQGLTSPTSPVPELMSNYNSATQSSNSETFLGIMNAQVTDLQQIANATANGQILVSELLGELQKYPSRKMFLKRRLSIKEAQLSANLTALQATQQMLTDLDSKILQGQLTQIESYATNIQALQVFIEYDQQQLNANQTKIAALQKTLNLYLSLLEQTTTTIQNNASWLQQESQDGSLFRACPHFILDLLKT